MSSNKIGWWVHKKLPMGIEILSLSDNGHWWFQAYGIMVTDRDGKEIPLYIEKFKDESLLDDEDYLIDGYNRVGSKEEMSREMLGRKKKREG